MRTRPYHHGDLRNALLDAASELIELDGVQGLSLRTLAQRAGVSHRATYRHFADKDALLALTLARGYNRLRYTILRNIDASAPCEQLLQIAASYAEFSVREPRMFLAMCAPYLSQPDIPDVVTDAVQDALRPTAAAIEAGIACGVFPDVVIADAALFFTSCLQGTLSQVLRRRIRVEPEARQSFVEQTARRLIAGLALQVVPRGGDL